MKRRLYISTDEAGYFDTNTMLCLDNPPTQGDFVVGDIVISRRQQNGIFGWVCVLSGSPGRWEVICDLKSIRNVIEKLEQAQDGIIEVEINGIKSRLDQLNLQYLNMDRDHKEELKNINNKVNENINTIIGLASEIENIKESAGNLQGSTEHIISVLNSEIKNNSNKIQTNTNKINENSNKIDSLIENVEEHTILIDEMYDTLEMVSENNSERNNQTLVSECIGVARSYYLARYNDNQEPTFNYNVNGTVLDTNYDVNGENKNSIDCSTFIGLLLRGIPFKKSPYGKLFTDNGPLLDDNDGGNETGNHDEYDDIYNGNAWDPMNIVANKDYSWSINPMDYKLKKNINSSELYPVRTASQLAQWMYERGWAIPLDTTFTNLEPGDIIFWAKRQGGEYIQPNRYKKISHVAICISKYDRPENDSSFPSNYPWKHTMLEVTTKAPYVLNRTLEKCSPNDVVMICRPDLGSVSADDYVGNINTKDGIDDLSYVFKPGFYYITSDIKNGLPVDLENGIYHSLKVERSMTRLGKVYSLIQTLVNTKNPNKIYMRTQYCYSHDPNNVDWTDWIVFNSSGSGIVDIIAREQIAKLENKIIEVNNRFDEIDGKYIKDETVTINKLEPYVQETIGSVDGIKQGLVNALNEVGIYADLAMTWKELFGLILTNSMNSNPGTGGGEVVLGDLELYKTGTLNQSTVFKNIAIDTSYLKSSYMQFNLPQNGSMVWFSFDGKVDFAKYESVVIEIQNPAKHDSYIGVSRNNNPELGYETSITNFEKSFMLSKNEEMIAEGSTVTHTLQLSNLAGQNNREGYLGFYIRRVSGTGGSVSDDIKITSIKVIPKTIIPCTGLSLDKSSISFNIGDPSITVKANVLPANCTDDITWRSTNTAVASVDNNGVITPKSVGNCIIRVTCGELTASCSVVVNKPSTTCSGITLKQHPVILEVGETINTNDVYEILPAGCTDDVKLTFTSVISIENGVIKGENVGSTTLTVKCGDHTVSLVVIVEESEIPCTGISLNVTQIVSHIPASNESVTQQLKATLRPSNTTNAVTWSSSNTNVATVNSNGLVSIKGSGNCVITATCGSKSATCSVTVKDITITAKQEYVSVNTNIGDYQLNMEEYFTFTNVDVDDVTWTIEKTSGDIGTLYNNGILGIDFQTVATARIIATYNGALSSTSASIIVKAVRAAIVCTGLRLSKTSLGFTGIGDIQTLVATPTPANTTDSVTWKSSNTNIATVSDGVVTSKANGSCIITATCGGKSVDCLVIVSVACRELTFDIDSLTIGVEAGTYNVAQYINVIPISCQLPVTWSIDKTSVATIDSNIGVLTPISVGTATITAYCGDKSATLPLTVNGVELNLSAYSSQMIKGEQHSFYAYLRNGDINKLIVNSSKPNALSIETVILSETSMSIRVTMLDEQAGAINFYYDGNLIERFNVYVRV